MPRRGPRPRRAVASDPDARRHPARALLLLLLASYVLACRKEPAPAAVPGLTPLPRAAAIPAPAPAEGEDAGIRTESVDALVLHLDGDATVQHAGSDEWVALKIGDAIRQGDAVRTASDGTVELGIGDAKVRLSERSSLDFAILAPKRVRMEVLGNAVASGTGGGVLELAAKDGDAVATLGSGQLALVVDASGRTVAASLEGDSRLSAGGKAQELAKGQVSSAGRSAGPSRPVSVPAKISLKVQWPAGAATNRPTLSLKGTASATSRVLVQGQAASLGPEGAFVVPVSLKRGKQRVSVVAVDVLGRRAADAREVTFDPDAPSIRGEVHYR